MAFRHVTHPSEDGRSHAEILVDTIEEFVVAIVRDETSNSLTDTVIRGHARADLLKAVLDA